MQGSFEVHSVPFYRGTVETAFAIEPVTTNGNSAGSSMKLDGWLVKQDGSPIPSCIAGPLIDDVSAYAVLTARAVDQWAVTSEISVDFHASIPQSVERLKCRAMAVSSDDESGFSTGELLAPDGQLLATFGQRMRFIPGDESLHLQQQSTEGSVNWAHSLDDWLKPSPSSEDGSSFQFCSTSKMANPFGTLHGGIGLTATVLAACQAWESSPAYPGVPYTPASVRMSYLSPGIIKDGFTISANIIYSSRSIVTIEVRTFGAADKLVSFGLVTLHKIKAPA